MAKQTEMAKMGGMSRPTPQSNNSDDVTPTTPLRTSSADSDEELVTAMEERLKGLGNEHSGIRTHRRNPANEVEEDEDDLELDDEEQDEEEDDVNENSDESGDEDDSADVGEEEDAEDDSDEDEAAALPDAYLRSAVAYGWGTEDEAKKFFNQDPQRALNVFGNIYKARVHATSEFARLGSQVAQAQRDAEPDKGKAPVLTDEKIAELKEKLGEDAAPLLDIIKAQQEMLTLSPANQETQPTQTEIPGSPHAAEESLVEQQIHQFFESDTMKPWEKIYGKLEFGETWEDLPPGQQQHRRKVLLKANDICGGAKLHGRSITMSEALESAHMLVTQKYRDQVLVDDLKSHAVKRHKAISVRPSKSKSKKSKASGNSGTPGQRTRAQLENATEKKLNALFAK